MALCINDSGTWRNTTTLCVNQSGTWRNIVTGCINQSGTWREFGFSPLGSACEGGFLICQSAGVNWIVAPSSTQVARNWYSRGDAVTTAQSVSGCTGWFVPNSTQLQNPGYTCRTYWDSYSGGDYWSNSESSASSAINVNFGSGHTTSSFKTRGYFVRAFRCVTY